MADWFSTKYFMLKHTASIWNGWFQNWFWNKLTLKRFPPTLSLSDLLPGLEAEPDLPHFIPWDHTSRIHSNSLSPDMGSAICSSSVALSPWLPKPWPPDAAPNISIRTVSSCRDPLLQFTYLSPYLFNSAICHGRCQHQLCTVRHSLGQSQLPGDLWPHLPAHRTQDTVATTVWFKAMGRSAIYLSSKELELVRQNPRARVEVVLLRKEILHNSHCSAQSNFTHHLRHAWGGEKLWGFNNSGPLAIKQPLFGTFKTTHPT